MTPTNKIVVYHHGSMCYDGSMVEHEGSNDKPLSVQLPAVRAYVDQTSGATASPLPKLQTAEMGHDGSEKANQPIKVSSLNNRRYRHANPEKARAHWMVGQELRYGRMEKKPCANCGSLNVHAHHDDYSKPLDVIWLCQPCHVRAHSLKDNPLRAKAAPKPRAPRKVKPEKFKRPTKKPQLIEAVSTLRAAGLSYKQIAKSTGVSTCTVYRWLNSVTYKHSKRKK